MNLVYDLLPWEQLFMLSSLGAALVGGSNLIARLRRKAVPRWRWLLLAVFGVLAVWPWLTVPAFGTRLQRSGQTNIADTRDNIEALGLVPLRVPYSRAIVEGAFPAVAAQLGWRIGPRVGDEWQFEVPLPGGLFVDDLRAELSEDDSETIINARSQSRVGRGDLGENRRHIVQFFMALDDYVRQDRQ